MLNELFFVFAIVLLLYGSSASQFVKVCLRFSRCTLPGQLLKNEADESTLERIVCFVRRSGEKQRNLVNFYHHITEVELSAILRFLDPVLSRALGVPASAPIQLLWG